MAELFKSFEVTATDKRGKRIVVLITHEKILPGNAFSKADADSVVLELKELLKGQ